MALFGKKKKSAAAIKAEIHRLRQQLADIEGTVQRSKEKQTLAPQRPKAVKRPPTKEQALQNSSSNALFTTLSHELLPPLNGALGMVQLLQEEIESSKLNTLESCALQIQTVLHTLVNLSKIQEQRENLPEYREWINLHNLIEQIKKNLTHRAAMRHLNIEVQHENNQLCLRGDYEHLTHIIESAILGSLECTVPNPETAASLRITWKVIEEEVKIVIENPLEAVTQQRGQRISEVMQLTTDDNHSRIRMEFLYWAVAISMLEHYDGAMIATPMGATGVKTTLGFKMENMLSPTSQQHPIGGLALSVEDQSPQVLTEIPFGMNILVVEDDPINRKLMALLLERIGQKAEFAHNGLVALDMIAQGTDYDVILMDIEMPVLDGTNATRAIRMGEAGTEAAEIPIVAVTAFNTLSDQSKFKKAGMDYFLRKPVSLQDLRSLLWDITQEEPVPDQQVALQA